MESVIVGSIQPSLAKFDLMTLRTRGYINLFLVVVFWGMTFPMQKAILSDLSPAFYNAFRFAIAVLLLIPFRRLRQNADKASLLKGIVLGLFLSGGYLFQTWGLRYTTASKSGFITALYVGIVAILSPVIEKKVPKPFQVLSLAVSLVGLYLITNPAGGLNIGDLLTTICAFCFALHVVMISYFTSNSNTNELSMLFPQLVVVAVINAIFIPFIPGEVFLTPSIGFVAVFTALFATIFAVVAQLKYQRFLGSVGASLVYVGEPGFAFLFAMILLNETLLTVEIVGLFVMSLGIILGSLSLFKQNLGAER